MARKKPPRTPPRTPQDQPLNLPPLGEKKHYRFQPNQSTTPREEIKNDPRPSDPSVAGDGLQIPRLADDEEEGEVLTFQAEEFRRIVSEQARRSIEGLRLYEPLTEQERFHQSQSRQRLLRGSNRGGKTLPAAVEIARAVTGQDPAGKYPGEDGRCYCVGRNLDHVGQVMWRKLSRPGAFKIIRDQTTGAWRAYRPWDPADQFRAREARPSPPLIPRRMIQTAAWENKAKGIPKQVRLTNGWELNFYSSEGKPPQGSDLDLVWFDEEITDEDWHPEMVARLLDRKGKLVWSATPQAGTDKLFELHERALEEKEKGVPEPAVEEFVILLMDNPHIGEAEKREFAASISELDQDVRIGGEFVLAGRRIFPEFSLAIHGTPWFEAPQDWTRYMVVDPGRQICAVLFAVVPPPEEGDQVYLEDELYIPNCNAQVFGKRVAQKAAGKRFEAFLIDHHGGRITDMGSGLTVEKQYAHELKKNRVQSRQTGHGFIWGSDDVDAGIEACKSWLLIRDNGTAKLQVLLDRHDPKKTNLPGFEWEAKRYRYKVIQGIVQDKPEDRGRVHQMANFRYLALFRPRYVRPPRTSTGPNGAVLAFRAKQKRLEAKEGGPGYIRLGPRQKQGEQHAW